MFSQQSRGRVIVYALLPAVVGALSASRAEACGGFFCSAIPVSQSAEQIIFRQDGEQVAAFVRIQYQGAAEDFSWVVPVPGIPDVEMSSELLFQQLDGLTRPSFQLRYEGDLCQRGPFFGVADGVAAPQADGNSPGGSVVVLEDKVVGPFNVQIINSDDADAMAKWLVDNGYDLTDRGAALIAPYVTEGMNFVALKLRKDKDVGDLVPLKMVYKTDRPMVPIRLTAVAATQDMGVIVWVVGPARAVPTNFPHVEVNYARLNWLGGTFSLYSDYVNLVTEAMNEAGGMGFATDFAGGGAELRERMPDVATLRETLDAQRNQLDPAQGLVQIARTLVYTQSKLSALFAEHLPLPPDESRFTYGNPQRLAEIFSFIQLRLALDAIAEGIRNDVIDPYEDAIGALDGEPYVTRLFTTLSADEMRVDPNFGYNGELPQQPAIREARLEGMCIFDTLHWRLVLGEGTGRDGEVIAEGTGDLPFTVPEDVSKQSAIREMRYLRETVDPMVVATGTTPYVNQTDASLCGVLSIPLLGLHVVGLVVVSRLRRRRSRA
ncbi:MAG TPA: DUF2330 domain-containing protein [Phycisphaerae bacterium]|nr:DUF2330 domain-containing protein [Phycisphaerae bacterium]HRW55350.1 DUF2330 domain-containing protein [Phycisphaerae bacterium]